MEVRVNRVRTRKVGEGHRKATENDIFEQVVAEAGSFILILSDGTRLGLTDLMMGRLRITCEATQLNVFPAAGNSVVLTAFDHEVSEAALKRNMRSARARLASAKARATPKWIEPGDKIRSRKR